MGLSSIQVSGDGLDWGQSFLQSGGLELPKPPPARRHHQQQPPELLPCPRCGSANTKFCYYNNYNKSQPRHFCKACKRHWTKGGTLRNVPVGGGRKNKRIKKPNTTTSTTTTSAATISSSTSRSYTHLGNQSQNLPLALGDQKNISEILYQALISPSASSQHDSVKKTANFNGNFVGSTLPLLQNQTPPFTFSTLCSFESNPSSISTSFRSSDDYNFTGGLVPAEDTIVVASQPWQIPISSSAMEMPNSWNWDDIDSLVSTEPNIPWDDIEVKR